MKLCHCIKPNLKADLNGYAQCTLCGNYFNTEKWRDNQMAKTKEAVDKGKVGRNTPCPCGSLKKFKHCCEGKKIWKLKPQSELRLIEGSKKPN